MENTNISKISSIIMSDVVVNEDSISLATYIELMSKVNSEIKKILKETIKKLNKKLSNNIAFFDNEIKSIEIDHDLILVINHDFKTKNVVVSFSNFKVKSDIKSKNTLEELIESDLRELVSYLKEYDYLDKIDIKGKDQDINMHVTAKKAEIFMYKSPNWITMGKAFSLAYDFMQNKYIYNVDSIGLEKSIKNQEKLLFSKLIFSKKLLPEKLLNKFQDLATTQKVTIKTNAVTRLVNFIRKLMKK